MKDTSEHVSRLRRNGAEMAERVRALRRERPAALQRELAAELGITRDLVAYYLTKRERNRAPRVSFRQKPGPKVIAPKTEHLVAMRQTAVRAVHAAFPHMKSTEIARALGFTRDQVRGYLGRESKARVPAWAELLFAGCRMLPLEQSGRSAEMFEQLAAALRNGGRMGAAAA